MRFLRHAALAALTACFPAAWLSAGARTLPIYIEESHAGTFYFLAETLAPDEPHTLLLFDAHSDASAIMESDAIRVAIRRTPSVEDRGKMFLEWRKRGSIQCFNWMEPLMPRPIAETIWVPARQLAREQLGAMESEARERLDTHEEASPRAEGPVAKAYRAMDFLTWKKETLGWEENRAVAASIDLDYFAAVPDADVPAQFEQMMDAVLRLRGLKALTFSISSPYQPSREKAERLLAMALDAACRVANADVQFEPFARNGPDRSLRALLLQRQGKEIPAFNLTHAGPEIRSIMLNHQLDARVRIEPKRMAEVRQAWAADPFLPQLTLETKQGLLLSDSDGVFRPARDAEWSVRLSPNPVGAMVHWKVLAPKESRYHISESNFGFGEGAPRWIYGASREIASGAAMESLASAALASCFDPALHCGTVRVFAEVTRDEQTWQSPPVVIAVRAAGTSGRRAAWSEQFGLPYVFGATFLQDGFRTGSEACLGTDCANFLIHGFRREGWMMPWNGAGGFTQMLKPADAIPQDGVICSFGSHVAGFWEDRPPLGALDDNDIFAHQLEGTPQLLALGALKAGRRAPKFLQLPHHQDCIRLIFTGDVMLGRSISTLISEKRDPFAAAMPWLFKADAVIGNLECAITSAPEPAGAKAYRFRAPPEAVPMLHKAGFRALGLANNHSLDFGAEGLADTQRLLAADGIQTCGASGPGRPNAFAPALMTVKDLKIAIFSVSAEDEPSPLMAAAGDPKFMAALGEARAAADYVVVMPHWGVENSRNVSSQQRAWARTWLQSGADLIVGSGPHALQEIEHLPRGSAAYSLGNFVFDGVAGTHEWNRGAALEVWIDARSARAVRVWLRPFQLKDGLPQAVQDP